MKPEKMNYEAVLKLNGFALLLLLNKKINNFGLVAVLSVLYM